MFYNSLFVFKEETSNPHPKTFARKDVEVFKGTNYNARGTFLTLPTNQRFEVRI